MKIVLCILLALVLTACSSERNASTIPDARIDEAFQILDRAIELNNQATEIANNTSLVVSAEEMNAILELRRAALVEARKVDIAALNAERDGFGDLFQDKFVGGLVLYVEGNGRSDLVAGQAQLAQWSVTVNAMR